MEMYPKISYKLCDILVFFSTVLYLVIIAFCWNWHPIQYDNPPKAFLNGIFFLPYCNGILILYRSGDLLIRVKENIIHGHRLSRSQFIKDIVFSFFPVIILSPLFIIYHFIYPYGAQGELGLIGITEHKAILYFASGIISLLYSISLLGKFFEIALTNDIHMFDVLNENLVQALLTPLWPLFPLFIVMLMSFGNPGFGYRDLYFFDIPFLLFFLIVIFRLLKNWSRCIRILKKYRALSEDADNCNHTL
ncbi:hypothetical protein JXA32_16215 [Candidatus Sumerlaeota bacterium]|nr:hypothetical protein [Candidatus Sumerlaeota bacterium]